MRQQINLYQPIFSESRAPQSFRLAAIVVGLVLAGLIVYSVLENSKLSRLTAEVETLRAEQAQQDALLATTNDQLASREKPVAVEARVRALELALTEREAALQILQSGAAGQTSGFATRMEALARRHVDGLWIDRLVLSSTNGSMTLMGATLDAETVPAYLHSLSRDPALSGTRFDDFIIEQPPLARAGSPELAATSEDGENKPPARSISFIRFRAGSKALVESSSAEEAGT